MTTTYTAEDIKNTGACEHGHAFPARTPCRVHGCTADTDHATLHRTSNGALLAALIRLTHSIHASDTARVAELDRTTDLRTQRDIIKAEILRRMA